MTTSYYTFQFGNQNVGYFEIAQEPDYIYQKAQFKMGDDEVLNIFQLKLDSGRLLAFKYQDEGEWVEMDRFEENAFPSSAYPLLLERATPTFTYQSIDEGAAIIAGEMLMSREEECITETQDGQTIRRFWITDGLVIKIDWGGPISHLVGSKEEAVAGSSYA